MRNYEFRLHHNKLAEVELQRNLNKCRWPYSKLLEEINKRYPVGLKRDYNAVRKILLLGLKILGRKPASKLVEKRLLHKIKPTKLVKLMQAGLLKREVTLEKSG